MRPSLPRYSWILAANFLVSCLAAPAAPVEPTPHPTIELRASSMAAVEPQVTPAEGEPTAAVQPAAASDPASVPGAGLTYQQPDGNRLVPGRGNLPALPPLDIPLLQRPTWITALPYEQGIIWAVVLQDGQARAYWVQDQKVQAVSIQPEKLPPGMPPLLYLSEGQPRLLPPPTDSTSASHPVFINAAGDLAYLNAAGRLVVQQMGEAVTLPVQALPDARLLLDAQGRLLLLTDPTEAYSHAVLGDALEAGSISLVETQPVPRLLQTIPMEPPFVIEGIAPLWVDWDGDGQREIIVTRSSAQTGAQIVMYSEAGRLLAAGPAIGLGFRWRHQLAVAPFAPDGRLELVDVLTPHIGGTVEFFQWQEERLEIVEQLGGHTSHVIGSPNLDMALAGRLDRSGRYTLLLPTQDRTQLSGIQRMASGATIAWQLPLEGALVTNLAAATTAAGEIGVAAGRVDGMRVWQP